MSDDDLRARADTGYAPSWRADTPGDEIIGTFLRLETGTSQDFGSCPIVIIDTADGERAVWLWHTALSAQFQRAQPQPGDRVLVRYLGEVEGKTGRTYRNYRVVTDQLRQSPVSWSGVQTGMADTGPVPAPESAASEADIPF